MQPRAGFPHGSLPTMSPFPGGLEWLVLLKLKPRGLHGDALARAIQRGSNNLIRVEGESDAGLAQDRVRFPREGRWLRGISHRPKVRADF